MTAALTGRRGYARAWADGARVMLDGAALSTPARNPLLLPPALAAAVAAEWDAQGKEIRPHTMPLTQLAMTAVDKVAPDPAAAIAGVLRYLESELICHYSDNADVAAFQRTRWQAAHAWVASRFGRALPVTDGIPSPPHDATWVAGTLDGYSHWQLAALQQAVAVTGSLVLGLMLVEDVMDAAGVLDAAEAEADYQAQRWGDDEATTARRAAQLAELRAVEEFTRSV